MVLPKVCSISSGVGSHFYTGRFKYQVRLEALNFLIADSHWTLGSENTCQRKPFNYSTQLCITITKHQRQLMYRDKIWFA